MSVDDNNTYLTLGTLSVPINLGVRRYSYPTLSITMATMIMTDNHKVVKAVAIINGMGLRTWDLG